MRNDLSILRVTLAWVTFMSVLQVFPEQAFPNLSSRGIFLRMRSKCTVPNAKLPLSVLRQPAKLMMTVRDLLLCGTETASSFHIENRLQKIVIEDNKNFWLLLTCLLRASYRKDERHCLVALVY